MRRNGPLALAFHALFVIFMLAPLVVVALVAFTPEGYLSLPVDGPSLRWFRAIGENPDFIDSFWISVRLGLASATLATVALLPAALAIGRFRFPGREAILGFVMSPLMVPAVVLGVGFLRFLTLFGVQGSFGGLVLCHAIVVGPYVLRMVLAAVAGLDPNLNRAAVSLGASSWRAFWRITVPLLLSGIAGGWILAFISSFDELTVTIFISSPQVTPLPLRLFSHIAETTDPLVASVSAVIMALTTVLLILLDRLYGVDRLFSGGRR
ncbi:ABC transporter permease [Rhodovastum atsumiense]|uniref:ABC transporter permease n=1 Tax=Rhodovastum atsumiense TaxID=504468 RepID=A0A5M6IR99_9PROT|nr:ABC transporter permease [Rhodovastum atsumiense]KAA5609975.1 ABC transporter permease [Rhodovastum atsumiense]CAH2598615.1 ABC transporter permease [Rhodovastum atsumiense]